MINKYKLNKFKDNLFLKEFLNCLKKGQTPPPNYVIWDCSRRCNLNCLHCGATKEKYEKELSTKQIKDLINQLSDMKVRFFAATGGEPLLRKDILEVMDYASKKGLKTGLATNGFFIDEIKSKKIKEAGISSIQISLDGPEEVHNKIRRNELSFQNAINAIKNLQKQKIKLLSVATTASPFNFDCLMELKKILLRLKVKNWRICVVMPIGRADKSLMLSPHNLKELFEFISSNKDDIKIQMGENLPFLAEYETKIRNSPLICPVGFTACCIGTDGYVRGCPEMPDVEKFREGSILEKSFKEIWNVGFKKYRERVAIKEDKKCADCKNKNECYGGCWVMREGNVHCIHDLLKNKYAPAGIRTRVLWTKTIDAGPDYTTGA
jgi:radical SAM protein with 4Fe4S-binding SPASM domain